MLKSLCLFCLALSGPLSAQGGYDPQALFAPLTLPGAATSLRGGSGQPGPQFWQNRVDYQIKARIDTQAKTLAADAVITYSNRSPDALDVLWLQLDQNIYRRDSRAALSSGHSRGHYTDGYQIQSVTLLGSEEKPLPFLVDDTRMRVDLPKPLAARTGSVQLRIRYQYQIPGTWGGRTAVTPSKNGEIYEIAQWFPRLAVYDDLRGWDTQPYLGAEFYLEYGSIDYAVTLPWDYLMVGSGKLVNPKEVLTASQRQRLEKAQQSDQTLYIRSPDEINDPASRPTQSGELTWRFHMDNTRDVAFAASKAFVLDAARIQLPGKKQALAMSAYPIEGVGKDKWDRSTQYLKGAVEHFSQWYTYPWPVAVNLGGHGAGMEYPGIVFDGMDDSGSLLFWITAHEIGHSWFPMIVGSNERRHAFMDEAFNTFIDVYFSDAFNGGEFAPKRDSEYAPGGGNPVDEILPILADQNAPTLMAPADSVSEKYRHAISYFKGALGLVLLREQILGPDRFDKAFKKYIATWAFKHPSPSDFFRMMESEAGEDLAWWWRGWYLNNWQLDMAVDKAAYQDADPAKGLKVTFCAHQPLVMPAKVRVDYQDGSHQDIRLPVEAWRQQGKPTVLLPTTKAVAKITLDPDHQIPDGNRANNSLIF
ncbi:M1 family metallopeptidase [Gallaecimonas xiamenensis]|uniref:Putative aminopeptidase n=1 Tax=Gallaecimonas xiamenensis 3-C-1 TaxID=745411 RepID=K2J225_9GAMM|nr:M1 family metallopeptidase [Gallaecimonas xiamenensis]EKE77031.1 putative aminopeptidase [Gallaecimonas xiamenensis 3-C-1]